MIGETIAAYLPVGETAAEALSRVAWREELKTHILAQVRAAAPAQENTRPAFPHLTGKGYRIDCYI